MLQNDSFPNPSTIIMVEENFQKSTSQILQSDSLPNPFTSTMVEQKISKINFSDAPE